MLRSYLNLLPGCLAFWGTFLGSQFAAAQDAAPAIKINEIMFEPDEDDPSGQWVELYNADENSAALKGWSLANRTGKAIAALPAWELPAGGYLVVYFSEGKNDDDFSDQAGAFYTSPEGTALHGDRDDLALYMAEPSEESIVDFVAYSVEGKREQNPSYEHAVAAGLWPVGTAFDDLAFMEEGNSIGRDGGSNDTNTPMDWWGQGGLDALLPTPGAANTHELGYELCGLTQSLALVSQLVGAPPKPETVENFRKALKQIREQHMDLIQGLGDSLLGNGEPQPQPNGDIIVGRIRFVFAPRLQHHGNNAGGKTYPPKELGGEIKVELSESALAEEWKMKDALLHEIGHAAQFQDALAGYWRGDRAAQSDSTQEKALKVHECNCYLSNLRLLCRLKTKGEFAEHAHAIDARIQFKVSKMEWYLNRAFESLAQFARNAETWALFGSRLADHLLSQRDQFLKAKVIAFKLPTEKERKAGKPGRLTKRERQAVHQQANRWNSLSGPGNQVTRADVNRLLNTDVDELIRELGAPPRPRQRVADTKGGKKKKEPVDEQAAAAARAEQARINKIREQEQDLERRWKIAESARAAASRELTAAKSFWEFAKDNLPNNERNKKLREGYEQRYKDAKKRHKEAAAAARQLARELKTFRGEHKEELAYVAPATHRRTLISGPRQAFATDFGTHAYASLEYVTSTGDPDNLATFDHWIASYQDMVGDDTTEAQELQQIADISTHVASTIDDVRDHLSNVRQQIQQANGDVTTIADILINETSQTPDDVPAEWLITPDDFRGEVFYRFAAAIGEQVLSQGRPTAGSGVIKEGAAQDSSSSVNPSLTLKLVVKDEEAAEDGGDSTETRVVQTDEQGDFKVDLKSFERLLEVRPGGQNVAGAATTPETTAHWDPNWRDLTPEQQYAVAQNLGYVGTLVVPQTMKGVIRRTPQPEYRDVVNGFVVSRAILSDTEGKIPPVLQGADLRDAFEDRGIIVVTDEQALTNESPSSIAFLRVINSIVGTDPKPEQVAVETNEPVEETAVDKLQQKVEQAVREVEGENAKVTVIVTQQRDFSFSAELGGDSTILTWDVLVRDAEGAPVELDKEQLQEALDQQFGDDPLVKSAQVAHPRIGTAESVNDPLFHSKGTWGEEYHDQWALRRVGFGEDADSLWPADSADVKPCTVAVIGSGVDWTHPELLGQMWINRGEDPYNGIDDDGNGYVDDQFGWNFRDQNADVMDHGGHDTHIAGVIAARNGNGRGIAGANPLARIMALKVANFRAQANSIDISQAVFYAVDNGARVINISYGGDKPAHIEQRAIDYAVSKGVLVVVAAGNKAKDTQQQALVSCRGALVVAGTTTEDKRATFSNWGQTIDLSAPSMDILSLRARGTDFLLYLGDDEHSSYQSGTGIVGKSRQYYRASGTSFAAPFVSGVASLILTEHPDFDAEQVRRMLIMAAEDVETRGWDQYTGAGIINAGKALEADPEHYLFARISQLQAVRRDGKIHIEVRGQADGGEITGRWLQIAFGESPERGDWQTVGYNKQAEPGGVLGTIPADRFDRGGTWSIRILAQDKRKTVRQGRATLNLQQ